MKKVLLFLLASALTIGCASAPVAESPGVTKTAFTSGYAPIGGLKMYYEIHGKGEPLVLLPGGGSTIETTYGRILPFLARSRQVIAVEEQGHGHTADINRPLTFEQTADDVAELLRQLKVEKADIMGFSNGGNVALQIAIRHPAVVRKLVVASAITRRDGMNPSFWEFMRHADLAQMPEGLKAGYLAVAPDPKGLQAMHDKCRDRMLKFQDLRVKDVKSIQAPTLLVVGDIDVVRPEHAVHVMRLLPQARLAVLPGAHGEAIGEINVVRPGSRVPELTASLIEEFLVDTKPIERKEKKRDE